MSGTALSTMHRAAEASVDAEGKIHYTVYYRVSMSSAGDGPQQVLMYLESQGIMWGISYDFANDSDIGTFCDGIQVRRIPSSTTEWEATVSYGPPQKMQDDDGNPSDEPANWRWQIDMGYATWQEAVWNAYNETPFPHPYQTGTAAWDCFTRTSGTYGPVVNSANVVLDPPLMRDMFDTVIRITTYSLTLDMLYPYTYMGTINNDAVRWSAYIRNVHQLSTHTFLTNTLKCTDASAISRVYEYKQQGFQVRIPYWEWNWEFRYRWIGWNEDVLDRGITQFPKSTGTDPRQLTEGTAPVGPALDSDDRRVPELVNFDGKGYPLLPSDDRWVEGYSFKWRKDYEASFIYPAIPFNFFEEVV
jgi:hypothetical protein